MNTFFDFDKMMDELYTKLFQTICDNNIPNDPNFVELCKVVLSYRNNTSTRLRAYPAVDWVKVFVDERRDQTIKMNTFFDFDKMMEELYNKLFDAIRDNNIPNDPSFLQLCRVVLQYRNSTSTTLRACPAADWVKIFIDERRDQ
jgi:hypothetical protein